MADAALRTGQDRAAPLVEMRRIEKRFPGVHALRGARLDLFSGEVHALMGENGAGKSTLMKILTGVNQPDSGEILIEGRPVTLPGPRDAQALGVSIIHQELHLMSHLSAAQNIFIGREPRRLFGAFVDETKANAAAAALFRRMRIDIDPRAEVGRMTVARQQLVEIAKALSFDARVLVMD
jgi:ribose transport system ATP-binding protein